MGDQIHLWVSTNSSEHPNRTASGYHSHDVNADDAGCARMLSEDEAFLVLLYGRNAMNGRKRQCSISDWKRSSIMVGKVDAAPELGRQHAISRLSTRINVPLLWQCLLL